jgi:6-oxo-cyclohex-1-ene-carbonyl-CoA hydrolase
VEGIRLKKKFFWDQAKVINRHWLAANMNNEAYLGFNAFNTKKITGQDTIDFIEFRRRQAGSAAFDVEFMAAVLGKPKE